MIKDDDDEARLILSLMSDEDATYVEDQGNEADRDTNANLEGRDDVWLMLCWIQNKALKTTSQNSNKTINLLKHSLLSLHRLTSTGKNKLKEAVDVEFHSKSDRIREEAQAEINNSLFNR
ncbi:hypothetical protein Tco_1549281 [Tanacetum coccineum]